MIPQWVDVSKVKCIANRSLPRTSDYYSYPAVRLGARISGKIMQELLDVAKHKVVKGGGGLMFSILSIYNKVYDIYLSKGRLSASKRTAINQSGKIVGSTSRNDVVMNSNPKSFSSIMCAVGYACESM